MSRIQQYYISEDRPESNSDRDLFEYCVKKVREKNLFTKAYMHNQWANILFGYEKNSYLRIDLMSVVKREYSIYFTNETKYSFDKNKIKRDFRYLWRNKEEDNDEEVTCEDLVNDNIKALIKEIVEQRDPHNIDSFKGSDLELVRKQGTFYIYHVRLNITDGQESNIHEGIPFILHVFSKEVPCEIVDYDYMSGILFFTTNRFLNSASYCKIVLDKIFILNELKERLEELRIKGVNEELPFSKFLFEDTNIIHKISHEPVSQSLCEKLDKTQKKAFNAAINNDLTFIWGPPGTGKSFTLASIIYALYQLGEERSVVCCLSNVAVDQLLCKLLDIIEPQNMVIEPGNVYRAGRSMDSRVISTDYLFPKDQITKKLREKISQNMEKIRILKEKKEDKSEEAILLKAENKELREKLKAHTEYLESSSRLVFSTISNFVLSDSLYQSKFDNLIIDEASMVAMPYLLALGNKISKRLILVGDFQQLSPIALVKDAWLSDSVFEMSGINIKNTNHPALHQLLHQRRSNENIVELINETFYQGKLIPSAKANEDIINSEPFSGKRIALKHNTEGAVRFTKGGTRQNVAFANSVMEILDEYYKNRKTKFTIGVITPYKGQVSLLRALKNKRSYSDDFEKRVKIGTVHTFQGSECDVIIFDMVDCFKPEKGQSLQIGKLFRGNTGERLLNVAVSRARQKLIVVCDPKYIKNIPGNTINPNTRKLFCKLSKY